MPTFKNYLNDKDNTNTEGECNRLNFSTSSTDAPYWKGPPVQKIYFQK